MLVSPEAASFNFHLVKKELGVELQEMFVTPSDCPFEFTMRQVNSVPWEKNMDKLKLQRDIPASPCHKYMYIYRKYIIKATSMLMTKIVENHVKRAIQLGFVLWTVCHFQVVF